MALQRQREDDVCNLQFGEDNASGKKSQIILDEEAYTEKIEKIIERDFFPDLPKLNIQKSYFDALEQNDLVKLRELQMKYGGKCPTTGRFSTVCESPASFETPELRSGQASSMKTRLLQPDGAERSHEPIKCGDTDAAERCVSTDADEGGFGLDSFLVRHTSEDNASFAEILEDSERRRQEKHAWLFEKEGIQDQEKAQKLALPGIEEQAVIRERPFNLETWTYKPDNTLMYVPKGVEYSAKELIELGKCKGRQVIHQNTHFTENPFATAGNRELLQKVAVQKALVNQGKIGHDGRELLASHTPQVNGFKLMGMPSPAPGVDGSPLMTWGEVEGTPLRLDPSQTPGPVFKIPDVPKRDKIAFALAEKASKAHRAKKEAALKQVTRRLTSPSPSMSPIERLNSMSPAAQRLVSKRLGIRTCTDNALRASYTPSPSRVSGEKTPVHLSTPSPSSSRWRSGKVASHSSPARQSPRRSTPKPSLTDNLLKLPKRQNASDFFSE